MKKIAIACQGGGSHTAFTAGALSHLAENWPEDHRLVGISGTSGGAICAALFWSAFIQGDPKSASQRLQNFWIDNSARTPLEASLNALLVWGTSLRGWVPTLDVTPYQVPPWGEQEFCKLLQRHLHFEQWNTHLDQDSPSLQLGAVEVLDGEFTVFDSRKQTLCRKMVLASAAIPNLFRAVEVQGRHYWDGLFSHNPPLVSLLPYDPAEIWVIQINPKRGRRLPTTFESIEDRRNELAGNLSLKQELSTIRMVNAMIKRGELKSSRCSPVELRHMELTCDLNYASKLERSPSFLQTLIRNGFEEAEKFLNGQESRCRL